MQGNQLFSVTGLALPAFDYAEQAQDATHDIWTFKVRGATGETVAVVTITYTDATKATIASVEKVVS